jgi:hypothetical protein
MAETKRRVRGEDSIYFYRSRDRWTGTVTVGWKPDSHRDRITVRGETETEVKEPRPRSKTSSAPTPRASRRHPVPASYTVKHCLTDWLETLTTQAETTVTGYRASR